MIELADIIPIDPLKIGSYIRSIKVAWRNLVHRMRSIDDRAKGVRFVGLIEPIPSREAVAIRVRILVDLASYPELKLMNWMGSRWAKRFTIRIARLQPDCPIDEVIRSVLSPDRLLDQRQQGSRKARNRFFRQLHEAGGFALLRFHIRPKRALSVMLCGEEVSRENEPMPFVLG